MVYVQYVYYHEYTSNYQIGYIVLDQFQTSKLFRGAGFIITCLTYHSECLLGFKRCSKYERKNRYVENRKL